MLYNFVSNKAYFKFFPVPDWEPNEYFFFFFFFFFAIGGNIEKLKQVSDNPAE